MNIKKPQPSNLKQPSRGQGGTASMSGWGRDLAPPGKNVAVPDHGYGHKLNKKWINYKNPYAGK